LSDEGRAEKGVVQQTLSRATLPSCGDDIARRLVRGSWREGTGRRATLLLMHSIYGAVDEGRSLGTRPGRVPSWRLHWAGGGGTGLAWGLGREDSLNACKEVPWEMVGLKGG